MINITNNPKIFEDTLNVFSSERYLSFCSNKYGWLYSDDFILPYIEKKTLFLRQLVFMIEPVSISENYSESSERLFLNNVIQKVKVMKIHMISQPPTFVVCNTYPDGSIFAPFGSYQVDLTLDEEMLFNNLHVKHRNVIRKAEKNSVEIKNSADLLDICSYSLHDTMERQGLNAISKDYLKRLKTVLGENIEFFAAYLNGEFQGCAIIPWNQNGAYYLYGGSIQRPYTGSLNLMQWHIIKFMKKRGVKLYDFVGARISPPKGSKIEGIQRFKKRFGTTMKKGFLWKYPISSSMYFIYKKAVLLQKQFSKSSYCGDIIDQEKNRHY